MLCHNEIIAKVQEGSGPMEEMCEVMAVQPAQAAVPPLRCEFYVEGI